MDLYAYKSKILETGIKVLLGSKRKGMGSAFHQLCPRYSGTLTPTTPTAIRLWETFTFYKCIRGQVRFNSYEFLTPWTDKVQGPVVQN